MTKEEDRRILINRVVSFLAGGLLVFAAMSITVVDQAKKKTEELTAELDASRYQAGRLLSDAKAQLKTQEYEKARASLTLLFEKHPGSPESADGKILLSAVEESNKAADAKWASAVAVVKQKWIAEKKEALRSASETARQQMEKDMDDKMDRDWKDSIDKVRKQWESDSRL